MNQVNPMEIHVKIVAWLHIVLGFLTILIAIFAGTFFALLGGLFGSSAAGGNAGSAAGGILGFLGAGMFAFIIVGVFAIPNLLVGWGLLQRASWGRILGIVVSILSLLHPVAFIGTAIAIYSLVILFQPDTAALFQNP